MSFDSSDATKTAAPGSAGTAVLAPAPLEVLVKAVRSVPVAPEILPKLQAKLLDVDTDISDLGALIKLDAGLASSVLKVSNSAYYSRSSEVTSIEDAVSFIGYQETLRLVARCSYSTVMKGTLDFYGVSGEQLWEEAVLAAFAMEQLSRTTGAEASEGYIAGLLHAIGMVAINDHLKRSGVSVQMPTGVSRADRIRWEREAVGWTHADVGAAMMRAWRFSPDVVNAVERQYAEELSDNEPLLNCLLPLAAAMAEYVRVQLEAEAPLGVEPEFDMTRGERAGFDANQLREITAQVSRDWVEMRRALL